MEESDNSNPMLGFCKNCPRRDTCTKLCATAAEYADQDYVGQHDAIQFGTMDFLSTEDKLVPKYGDVDIGILRVISIKQREVIILYYDDGLSMYEIAEKLGVDPTSVRDRLKYAKKKLERELSKRGTVN